MNDGRRASGPRVVLCARTGSGNVAVVASRKIGGAVERNRAKRILRAAMRDAAHDLTEDLDIVLIARKPVAGASSVEITLELRDLVRRIDGGSV